MFAIGRAASVFLLAGLTLTAAVRHIAKAKQPAPVLQPDKLMGTDKQIAQRWMKGLTLHDMVAQLIVITSYGESPSAQSGMFRDYVHEIRDLHVGGLIVANHVQNGVVRQAEPFALAAFLNRMQKLAKIPLLTAADFERGASMRVSGTTKYPHLMAYGAAHDRTLTRDLGAATAKEARALGINWVFAPDADVNNNPDNPIINIRSFGENPQDVAAEVKAFIEGAHSDPKNRVLVTAKHFPGHGDTNVDSHMGLATLSADRKRIDEVELVPFRAAIASNVDSVMTAHMAVLAIDREDVPATVSQKILTGLLRKDLSFNGLIVTDAMEMQALTKQFSNGEAAVRSLEAGADVLLMPPNADEAIRAVMVALRDGRLSRKKIEGSAMKVLSAKAHLGLAKNRLVNIEEVSDALETPQEEQKALTVAQRAIVLTKNDLPKNGMGKADRGMVPIDPAANGCLFVLSESRFGQQGRKLLEQMQKRSRSIHAVLLDPLMPQVEIDQVLQKASGCELNIIAAFVTANAYKGTVSLAGNFTGLVNGLIAGKAPVLLISLGNPYLLRSFSGVCAYMATFSSVSTSEIAAVQALFGEVPITGKLPVTIPGIAAYGDGFQLPAATRSNGPS